MGEESQRSVPGTSPYPVSDRERWNDRYSTPRPPEAKPSPLLIEAIDGLPPAVTVLDVAGGDGVDGCFLARERRSVTILDVSDVALAAARERAAGLGVAIDTVQADLETDPLPGGRWGIIHLAHYLNRSVIGAAAEQTSGWLLIAIATTINLERNARPSPRFLLRPGELRSLLDRHTDRLHIVRSDEGWRPNDQHEAWLIANVK